MHQLLAALRRRGATHVTHLRRVYEIETATEKWAWRTKAGNIGAFTMDNPLAPTPEELTAMFVAIKLTD
jgi:hypothetical protein